MNEKPRYKSCCASDTMAHALYYQTSQLSNQTACDGITLSEVAAESCGDFCTDGNTFQIRKPGVYLVTYVINIPSTMAVNTTFALQVNRQNVASTVRPVVKVATDSTLSITAQAILAVSTPVTLRIASSSLITVTGAATETMASLSIIQLTQC